MAAYRIVVSCDDRRLFVRFREMTILDPGVIEWLTNHIGRRMPASARQFGPGQWTMRSLDARRTMIIFYNQSAARLFAERYALNLDCVIEMPISELKLRVAA